MPLALVVLLLVVSGPSMVIAYFKLRKRNLAPLLDANGWAINTRAIINIPFGASLTRLAKLPPGAQRSFTDPFAEKKTPWKFYLFLALLIGGIAFLWHKGYLQEGWERYVVKDSAVEVEDAAQPPAPEPEPESVSEPEPEPEPEPVSEPEPPAADE
jgi:hypothetical protein